MRTWLGHSLRGVCMGVADAIPGVSGGTLALILGIYERFIGAVSAVGPRMLRLALTRELWVRMLRGVRDPEALGDDEVGTYAGHIVFLGFLFVGILAALLVGARFIPTLLDVYPAQMKGFFFGLVLASVVIPYRMVKDHGPAQMAAVVLAAVLTYFFVGLPIDESQRAEGTVTVTLPAPVGEARTLSAQSVVFLTDRHGGKEKREVAFGPRGDVVLTPGQETFELAVQARMAGVSANLPAGQLQSVRGLPEGTAVLQVAPMEGGVDPAMWWLFLAGVIAISAMVLPGLSGSFILLMLGLYHYLTFNVRALVYEQDASAMVPVAVFVAAVVVGITSFSRILKWLLARWHDTTMAALAGLMIGSLRKIWPFSTTGPGGEQVNQIPDTLDTTVLVTIGTFVIGAVLVTALERAGRQALSRAR